MFISAYDKDVEGKVFEIFRGGRYDLHLCILYDDLENGLNELTKIFKSKSIKIPVNNSFFSKTQPVEMLAFKKNDLETSSVRYFSHQLEINIGSETLKNLIRNLKEALQSGEYYPSEVTELSTALGYEITLYASVGY